VNAVNLLPPDLRRGPGAPARSGAAVYVLLGVLAAALVLVATSAVLNRMKADREADVAKIEAEAQVAEQRAATLTEYKALAAAAATKVSGVRKVAAGRVDWSRKLTEVSRTVGREVAFASLSASSAPGAGGTAAANPLRGAIAGPALEVVGCARDNAAVARLMSRFRAMDGVKRVSLSSTDKGNGAGATTGESASSGDCRVGGRLPSQFNIVIFIDHAAPAAVPADGTTAAAAQGSTGGNG
jgi:Tfp pilus assembly protein PilN